LKTMGRLVRAALCFSHFQAIALGASHGGKRMVLKHMGLTGGAWHEASWLGALTLPPVLSGVNMPMQEVVALLIATSFAAGLNTYATVGTLGLLARYHVLGLPDGLNILTNWWVIGVALTMFVVEFFADKIPAFDLIWNALHTFIRIPVAALLAYKATAQLSPQEQMIATIAGGLIALAAHGGKTAARAAVSPSPEPFSNSVLSLTEDALAIGITWLATSHPYAAAGIVLVGLVFVVLIIRFVVRSLKSLFRGAEERIERESPARAA
jgi:hypothetical protein